MDVRMLTDKDIMEFIVAAEILQFLKGKDGVLSIGTNTVKSSMYPGEIDVNMTAKGFFASFGDKDYEYRHFGEGNILVGYTEPTMCIDFHATIPNYVFLDECGGIK